MSDLITYLCEDPYCHLGARGEPGRFTGGITADQALILTGNPDAAHGDGVCPNCGTAGRPEE